MKNQINDDLVESFEVKNAEVVSSDEDSRVRKHITTGLLLLFGAAVLGGMVYSFLHEDTALFKSVLDAITHFVAIAIGYFFGKTTGTAK